jgi:hypothetical protein
MLWYLGMARPAVREGLGDLDVDGLRTLAEKHRDHVAGRIALEALDFS